MIYLDHGATSFPKPAAVHQAVQTALLRCANPGRGSHPAAMAAAKVVYDCREEAAQLFHCQPEQVVMTSNCTHGLNIAIRSLVQPGDSVVISGFEHNAVTRPLHALGAKVTVAGRRVFDHGDTLDNFEKAIKNGAKIGVFTHISNVFGYILPIEEMAMLCRQYGIAFIVDAAQSAGCLDINFGQLGADFVAMPGHKGLLGPQGTGLLLCRQATKPLLFGGTGSDSIRQEMPEYLPERLEAGTVNVPGIAGLAAGLRYVRQFGIERIFRTEQWAAKQAAAGLKRMGMKVFDGPHQNGTVSFVPQEDCEEMGQKLARRGIAVRAGLHCAPLAHESAGTLQTGTLRVSFGHDATAAQVGGFLRQMAALS